ncbi:Uncharacterized protein APZ42_023026 [Daphnia magna]|uniref:Uncharacterized protein n=1 Tax=Daphnia magna TaxID=35525 RepID=A0A164VA37_9CRUS|nr:Uncharacterized protein APZ42_023026 [Daphnia magna]
MALLLLQRQINSVAMANIIIFKKIVRSFFRERYVCLASLAFSLLVPTCVSGNYASWIY